MKLFNPKSTKALLLLFVFNKMISAGDIRISGRISDAKTLSAISQAKIQLDNYSTGKTDTLLTQTDGTWEYIFSTTEVSDNGTQPANFWVSQNYPNPFNPSTRIDLQLPSFTRVEITIYNILGEQLDFRGEYLQAGNYFIEWRANGNAGVYFFKIKSDHGSITKKMTLLDHCSGAGLTSFLPGNSRAKNLSKTATSIPIRIISSKFGYIADTTEADVLGGEYFEIGIETIHSRCLVIDLHNDILEKMIENPDYHLGDYHNYNHTDIPRLQMGGVDVQFFAVWVDPSSHLYDSYAHACRMITLFKNELVLNPATIAQAYSPAETISITSENKITGIIGVEGGHAIENSLQKLIELYQQGMRYLTITWDNSTDWAVSAADSRSKTVGLSEFGKTVIRTMDSLGVIIDVSHVGIKTIEDILATTTNPIVATHSGARTLCDHYRNLYNNQIIAIANSGGVIGIVFYPPYLSSSGHASITTVVNHIDHIVNLVGVDYVALGSDFDGIGNNTVYGLNNVTKFPDLTLALLRRGYSQSEVEKILGLNFMRVFEEVSHSKK